ncbi:hypothetical protein F2S88_29740 [Pseudomonas syringae pv. actinidiae]|nr:hypothetical protein [Pseudomonas syringae pv. actinidiae]
MTDAAGTGYGQYFKYYMPGVGTPFAEVGDLDYSTVGLAGAWFGEERINWGLLMLVDALRRTLVCRGWTTRTCWRRFRQWARGLGWGLSTARPIGRQCSASNSRRLNSRCASP